MPFTDFDDRPLSYYIVLVDDGAEIIQTQWGTDLDGRTLLTNRRFTDETEARLVLFTLLAIIDDARDLKVLADWMKTYYEKPLD